ncbi:MAG TPA: CDP-diacylglycerol--glycerol-3-phosphate 3-phosphatidyltransferase [Sporichthyaceae bacterium]|nr:CDP-diacylglycerol--glycerol-3-phosphate 3-phosphatidyltransferase [Sporichthyaceae bacterium]
MSSLAQDHLTDPVARVGTANLANGLTLVRLLLVPVFVAVLFHDGGHEFEWRWWAWVVFAIAAFTDTVDGRIARRRCIVTDFGKIADPIADKALSGAALAGLSSLGDLPWAVTAVVLTREIGVTALRFWVIRLGVIPASRGGKLKTMLLGFGTGFWILPFTGFGHDIARVLMSAAVVVALVTGFDYTLRALRLRRAAAVH